MPDESGISPSTIAIILGIVSTIIGGIGVLGKFALDFIKTERSNSMVLTDKFVAQLEKQGEQCTQERVAQASLMEAMQQRMFETLNKASETIREHTESSKENYRISIIISDQQRQIISKLSELTEALTLDRQDRLIAQERARNAGSSQRPNT